MSALLTPSWFPMRYHPVQSALWRSPARFKKVPAGRRSGKTEIARRWLVRMLPVPGSHNDTHMLAYLAPTRLQGKRFHWDKLKRMVPDQWLSGRPLDSDMMMRIKIRYATGIHSAELWVIGMDKPQRFEGSPWDVVVKDESSDHKPKVFANTIRPALADRQGRCWEIGVPKRQGSGALDYRQECELGLRGLDPETATFSWPSWDVLPQSEVDSLRSAMDEKDFLEQIGGQWQNMGGSAFYAFDRDAHVVDCPHDPTKTIFVGCDFNVNPMGWVLCQLTDDASGLKVIDEIWLSDTNTRRTLDVLWDRYGEKQKAGGGSWWFYGDAASQQRHTSATRSDYAHIKNDTRFNARVTFPKANPDRKDRASSCNALLRNAAGVVRCWIDKRAVHLLADLQYRGLDKDGAPAEGKSGGEIGHISDGWGYLIHHRWPVTRIIQKSTPRIGVFTGEG